MVHADVAKVESRQRLRLIGRRDRRRADTADTVVDRLVGCCDGG
jgi:hypothetical protein